jgi:histidinol dehydrogenase
MRILRGKAAADRVTALAARASRITSKEPEVKRIVAAVRRRGDAALREYARNWDRRGTQSLRVNAVQMQRSLKLMPPELMAHVKLAEGNIRSFAERQKPAEWMHNRCGVSVGQLVRPLDSVGCYVPSGRYPLLSTLLMTVVPAQVAGVPRICVVSPNPEPELLAIAHGLGVKEFYRVGGAQAIAALAYGTKSIPRVDKIVGPGNAYVTAAKKLVAFDCAIDMLAGPTESVIVSRDGNPEWVAADLLAQAEHDPDALPILITCSQRLAEQTIASLRAMARTNPIAQQSLKNNGCILVARSQSEAMDWANRLAPEHITVSEPDVARVRNAGSVFVGEYSPQAAGDYATGPNHVLPTGGVARFRGGLTVFDFVKLVTVQRVSRQGLRGLAPTITALAEMEGLKGHAQSIRTRFQNA